MDETVTDRVRELLPLIEQGAGARDAERQLTAADVRGLTAAGAFGMLVPDRYGGSEADPRTFYDVVRALAGACASTGWVVSLLGVNAWHVALLPQQAQEEVWETGPATLVCSSYAPAGRMTPVDGGYRLSGRWRFSSGSDHAIWALLGAVAVSRDGELVDVVTVLVPRSECAGDRVWDTVGLRGTGSNDLVAHSLFVPGHRVLRTHERARMRGPGQLTNPGPLYRMPFGALFATATTAPLVGAVEGCLTAYLESLRDRSGLTPAGTRFGANQFAQAAFARAASEVDAAALPLDRDIAELYECASRSEPIPLELRLRTRRDQVCGTERAVRAIDLLFTHAGAAALRSGNRVERAWRDVHAGSTHLANDVEHALALYGGGVLGLPVEDALM
ncbi:acyl-CoA dehydrogenase family protein [Streptomyces sp. ID03-2B]|uniref:3-hydroxy-9,10-secoandrosta-1,3,5(10)-triene-9, 17-dione monooxygenase oxygenase subunit n=1 Tax=Streptomyces caviscabies TaxID=90079 RepID=A0ABW2MAA6_9ACTN|nr:MULTISPECIES: 3-hydroxy-9,10-secoandrosta-1,3,5(10)-triene-9,17-dione monooxygenase oxygenase subunit [unclassified Streptomyces]MCL6289141.1 acyl-CoA dehydrogenase family protein [Streptomyces sp. 43Y-GA-1]MDX3339039.1 acyl-CoA dehydrogenase family protein [Streptomyces sp. ME02-6979.5a]MDX3506406.1 acyl-CoA dehydrogenase family protein [Streptomyces sp. ATCC51928]MDX3589883.1 acyl-CoA dehydrogenase family protein [Streptomyces sp. ID03-2B]MDX5522253.1 acyl-CoA dehydrogenase family protein